MSSREFGEWIAYYELEPWGDEYEAAERAQIAWILANAFRDGKKQKEPYGFGRFMLRGSGIGDQGSDSPSDMNMLVQVEALNRAFGGRDLRKK